MLTRSEIRGCLTARGTAQEELFAEARRLREEHFGPTVVLRGVIEIAHVCRVNFDGSVFLDAPATTDALRYAS